MKLLARCTFPQGDVTCAVSGGADSLALLVLAVEAGCTVTAVHVDHGLAAQAAVVGLVGLGPVADQLPVGPHERGGDLDSVG